MELSSARRLAAPCVPQSWSRLWWVAATISLLSVGSAAAQTAAAPRAKVDAANTAWRKLSQSEINCVDKALRARNSQIWLLIERGVGPADASVAGVRATCRTQAQANSQGSSQASSQARPEAPALSAAAQHAALARAAQPSMVQTSGRDHWSFNGSILNMVADGSLRKFFYFRPDADAEAGGAQRGDLFLEGRVSDQRFAGTVYGFEGRCGRIPYRVDGTIRDNNRRLELQGQKPRVDGNCTVVGTMLDALTFRSVEQATAVAAAPPAVKPDVPRPVAAKPAIKPAIEQAAAVMAAADRAAVERAETDDAAEFKIAPDSAPAGRPVAGEATPVKIVTAATSESKVAVNQAVAEKASAGTAVEIARADAARAQADAERARNEAEKAVADAIAIVASAQSKISFLYGLISGPALLGVGATVLLLVRRRRQALLDPSAS